ncbi:PapD-like protein [Spinellus fusiger]|nr:PapD-like protein [Spinellus fusiger]
MSVVIEPISQLTFQRPLTETSKEILYVRNPGTEPVSFKVKTTAPRQYCVRPNAGRIEPDAQVEVQVILQPFKEEPPLDYKCRDKFLVQTAVIKSAYETLSTADMVIEPMKIERVFPVA